MARAAKYAGDPFSLGVGGRGLALGGAVVAGPFDASAPYWNPAGMTDLRGRSALAMHAETFGSLLNHDFAGYVHHRGDSTATIQAYGFYFYYLGGGGIKITQLNEYDRPEVVREESHADILLAAALAGQFRPNLHFGLTAKVIYRDLGPESGQGLSVDAGLLYDLHARLRLGLAVTDITTGFIRYPGETSGGGSYSESIYPTVKPGLLVRHSTGDFTGRFVATGDIKFENLGEAAQVSAGSFSLDSHFGLEIGYLEMVFGRAGIDIGRFTAGAGLELRRVTLDFAYLHDGELDDTFRVSAGLHW
jgi:hypothetical protein